MVDASQVLDVDMLEWVICSCCQVQLEASEAADIEEVTASNEAP